MKLLTKEIVQKAKAQYKLGSNMEQMVVAKFFNPTGAGTWYLMNMDEENYCWGICYINCWEIGRFSLEELKSIELPFGMGIERKWEFSDKAPLIERKWVDKSMLSFYIRNYK